MLSQYNLGKEEWPYHVAAEQIFAREVPRHKAHEDATPRVECARIPSGIGTLDNSHDVWMVSATQRERLDYDRGPPAVISMDWQGLQLTYPPGRG